MMSAVNIAETGMPQRHKNRNMFHYINIEKIAVAIGPFIAANTQLPCTAPKVYLQHTNNS